METKESRSGFNPYSQLSPTSVMFTLKLLYKSALTRIFSSFKISFRRYSTTPPQRWPCSVFLIPKLTLPCLPGTHLSSSSRSNSRYYNNDISIRSLLCSTATSSQITYQDCFLCNVEHCPCCAAVLCGHNLCTVACSLRRVELE